MEQTLVSLIVLIAYGIYSAYAAVQEAKKKKEAPPPKPELTIEEELRKYLGEIEAPVETTPPKAAPIVAEVTEEHEKGSEAELRPELSQNRKQRKLFDEDRSTKEDNEEHQPQVVSLAAEREQLTYESLAEQQYKERPRKDIFQQLRDENAERKRKAIERAKQRRASSAFGKSFSFNIRDAVIYSIIMENKFDSK